MKKLNIIPIVVLILVLFFTFKSCNSDEKKIKDLEKRAESAEELASNFEKLNENLIGSQRTYEEIIDTLQNRNKTITKEVVKIKTKVVYVKDTTTAKRYITERYGDSTINVVNDLIDGDVCKQEVKLLNNKIQNQDKIITYKDSLIINGKEVSNNLESALNQIKIANNTNKEMNIETTKQLKNRNTENIFLRIGILALGIFAVTK